MQESCIIGDNCTSRSIGVGLLDGDRIMLKLTSCTDHQLVQGMMNGGISRGALDAGSTYRFGVLEIRAMPAIYRKCWCRAIGDTSCSRPEDFLSDSGTVTLECPAGYFAIGQACRICTRGYYCLGQASPKQACAPGQTTHDVGAASADDCLCKAGYELQAPHMFAASGLCVNIH